LPQRQDGGTRAGSTPKPSKIGREVRPDASPLSAPRRQSGGVMSFMGGLSPGVVVTEGGSFLRHMPKSKVMRPSSTSSAKGIRSGMIRSRKNSAPVNRKSWGKRKPPAKRAIRAGSIPRGDAVISKILMRGRESHHPCTWPGEAREVHKSQRLCSCSSSSRLFGQSFLSRRDSTRSASRRPSVWHLTQ